jgi:hypothetical protein
MNNSTHERRRRTLEEWNKIKDSYKSRSKKNKEIINELKTLISSYNPTDVRFFFIRDYDKKGNIQNKGFTCVTVIDRQTHKITVSFSFCNKNDRFDRKFGKIKCLKQINDPNHKYTKTIQWSGNSMNDMFKVFNSIEKPFQFSKWNFISTTFLDKHRKELELIK